MKKHNVYKLVNNEGKIVYIGETLNPRVRFNLHVSKNGKFKREDVSMVIIKSFDNKSDAFNYQCELQLKYGLQTDKEKCKISNSYIKNYFGWKTRRNKNKIL